MMIVRRWIIVTACWALAACGQGPGDAARMAVEDAARGRTAEALERIDPEVKATASIFLAPVLQDKAAKARKKGGVTSVEVETVTQADADHATVATVTHFADGSMQRDSGKVRRIDGAWYITM